MSVAVEELVAFFAEDQLEYASEFADLLDDAFEEMIPSGACQLDSIKIDNGPKVPVVRFYVTAIKAHDPKLSAGFDMFSADQLRYIAFALQANATNEHVQLRYDDEIGAMGDEVDPSFIIILG